MKKNKSTCYPLLASLLYLLALLSQPCQAKSIYWESLDVIAHLESNGALHVTERQHMVFDGDWNGGERVFWLDFGHQLELLGMRRIDVQSGDVIEMQDGDLHELNNYSLVNGNTLRWRSRHPGDAPFRHTGIVYEIEYRMSGILKKQADNFLLRHDFAFSDRDGVIKQFSLKLTVADVWKANRPMPVLLQHQKLPPGQGVVFELPLAYAGSDKPAAVIMAVESYSLIWVGALFCVLLAWRFIAYINYERNHVRFQNVAVPGHIDDAWLEQNVFIYPAEKIGSLWDARTGPVEVVALLARLVQEGKLKSCIEKRGWWIFKREVLQLQRIQPLNVFNAYEKHLLDSLFVGSDENVTDTDIIKNYYREKGQGFDPVSKIRASLMSKGAPTKHYRQQNNTAWRLTMGLFVSGLLCMLATAFQHIEFLVSMVPLLVLSFVFAVVLTVRSVRVRTEVETPYRALIGMLLLYLVYLALVVTVLYFSYDFLPLIAYLGVAFWAAAVFNSLMNGMKTPVSKRRIKLRKQLCAVRRYFMNELKKAQPRIRDEWYPYLIAFELEDRMARWLRAFGGSSTGTTHQGWARSSSSSSSSSSSMTSGWSGGGGSFGGAGASGAWAAAAGAISAGVAPPSSSSSGGGSSGGGGGSSGGGGGGGW